MEEVTDEQIESYRRYKKKMKFTTLITSLIIGVVIVMALALIIFKPSPSVSEEDARCIGSRAVLFSQSGCVHCLIQLELFGDKQNLLTIVDCVKVDWCLDAGIEATPTWQIENKTFEGVYSIDELKEMTGCP